MAARCRWKGEATRWAAERLLRIREGNDVPIENTMMLPEIIEWANRLTDCFYWVKSSESTERADLSLLFDVGGCFDTLADALAVVRAMLEKNPGNQKVLDRMLPLVAEAQSALRARALKRLCGSRRPGAVGSLRMANDDRRPAPRLPQAVHAR